jgi:hypothetical protein
MRRESLCQQWLGEITGKRLIAVRSRKLTNILAGGVLSAPQTVEDQPSSATPQALPFAIRVFLM